MALLFPEADIILLEGFKNSEHPKYVCNYPEEVPEPKEVADIIMSLKIITNENISDCVK